MDHSLFTTYSQITKDFLQYSPHRAAINLFQLSISLQGLVIIITLYDVPKFLNLLLMKNKLFFFLDNIFLKFILLNLQELVKMMNIIDINYIMKVIDHRKIVKLCCATQLHI